MIRIHNILKVVVASCDMPGCRKCLIDKCTHNTGHDAMVGAMLKTIAKQGWTMELSPVGHRTWCPTHSPIDHFTTEDAIRDMQSVRTNTDTTLSNTNMINMMNMM